MFWVVAAPTPARAKAQRAVTAGDEEATATANRPVDAQRAAMENVIGLGLVLLCEKLSNTAFLAIRLMPGEVARSRRDRLC